MTHLPQGPAKRNLVRNMFDVIAPRYDLINRLMTLGMDVRWRRDTVQALGLPPGSLVADVACGTGDLSRELRKARYRAVGFDLSKGMLAAARTKAPLVLADALALPLRDGSCAGVTCGFALRNVVDLGRLFEEFRRVLGAGGRISILEVSTPSSAVLRAGHSVYFRKVVPMVGGLLSDKKAYEYLPQSTAYLPEWPELKDMLFSAGFIDVRRRPVGMGAAQIITGTRS